MAAGSGDGQGAMFCSPLERNRFEISVPRTLGGLAGPGCAIIGCALARTVARDAMEFAQHRQVGAVRRGSKVHVWQIGDRDETDMRVFAVEGTPGQRLVDVLEPMGADEIGVVGDSTKVPGVCGPAFALGARTDEAFPEQPAIG